MKPRMLIGVLIILVGGLLLLGNLQILEVDSIWQFWPLILLVAGVNMLVRCGWGRGCEGGIILTVLGGAFMLRNLGLIDWRVRQFWPLLLILFGIMVVIGSLRPGGVGVVRAGQGPKRFGATTESKPTLNLFTALGALEHKNSSEVFQGGEVSSVMGGVEVDLRGAKLADGGAEIQCFVFMGGIEIKVPQDWSVEVRGTPVLGYFGNTTHTAPLAGSTPGGPGRRLVVKGQVIMGAVEVKN